MIPVVEHNYLRGGAPSRGPSLARAGYLSQRGAAHQFYHYNWELYYYVPVNLITAHDFTAVCAAHFGQRCADDLCAVTRWLD